MIGTEGIFNNRGFISVRYIGEGLSCERRGRVSTASLERVAMVDRTAIGTRGITCFDIHHQGVS